MHKHQLAHDTFVISTRDSFSDSYSTLLSSRNIDYLQGVVGVFEVRKGGYSLMMNDIEKLEKAQSAVATQKGRSLTALFSLLISSLTHSSSVSLSVYMLMELAEMRFLFYHLPP